MNKDTYVPEYDTTVTIGIPDLPETFVHVNPRYCLTPASADQLKAILVTGGLGPIGIEMLAPQINFTRFSYSKLVPWFVYSNGTMENAAFVAWNWIGNRKGDVALLYASQEVFDVMEGR